MRHRIYGRQFGRSKNERSALFRNLIGELILYGRVKTTAAKALAVKPFVDKLVTRAKRADLTSRRELIARLPKQAAFLLIDTIAPHFANRTSGFSRIIHMVPRKGDQAEMVLLEWVEKIEIKNKQSLRSSELQKSKIKNEEPIKKLKQPKIKKVSKPKRA